MNKTFLRSVAATAGMMGLAGLACTFITAGSYSSELQIKEQRIIELERAVEALEEANTSLKSESEVKQVMIDNLEWQLEELN